MIKDLDKFYVSDIQSRETKFYRDELHLVDDDYNEDDFIICFVDAPLSYTQEYFGELDDNIIGGEIWIYASTDGSQVFFAEIIKYSEYGDEGDYCEVDIDEAKEIFERMKGDRRYVQY